MVGEEGASVLSPQSQSEMTQVSPTDPRTLIILQGIWSLPFHPK